MIAYDVMLIKRIDKKFDGDELDLYKQGDITYLNIAIALDEMFTIGNTVDTTIQGFYEILEGFTQCSVGVFLQTFAHLLVAD